MNNENTKKSDEFSLLPHTKNIQKLKDGTYLYKNANIAWSTLVERKVKQSSNGEFIPPFFDVAISLDSEEYQFFTALQDNFLSKYGLSEEKNNANVFKGIFYKKNEATSEERQKEADNPLVVMRSAVSKNFPVIDEITGRIICSKSIPLTKEEKKTYLPSTNEDFKRGTIVNIIFRPLFTPKTEQAQSKNKLELVMDCVVVKEKLSKLEMAILEAKPVLTPKEDVLAVAQVLKDMNLNITALADESDAPTTIENQVTDQVTEEATESKAQPKLDDDDVPF